MLSVVDSLRTETMPQAGKDTLPASVARVQSLPRATLSQSDQSKEGQEDGR